jgi:hypothetical protein
VGKRKSPSVHYFCEDCLLPFTVYLESKGRVKRFCPYCGENTSIKKYEGLHKVTGEQGKKIKWKPEEMELIQDVINGKKTQMQVAHLLGRSVHSVSKKVGRVRNGI